MNYKENKSYYFIQLELLHLKNITKIFGEEQSQGIKDYFFTSSLGIELKLNRSVVLNVFFSMSLGSIHLVYIASLLIFVNVGKL